MGLQVTARKSRSTFSGAYLMIFGISMQKYLRPTTQIDPDTGANIVVQAVQYVGRWQLYGDYQDRVENFGNALATSAFTFEHVNGADPVHECYAHIHANGVDGWVLNDLVDILIDPPQP